MSDDVEKPLPDGNERVAELEAKLAALGADLTARESDLAREREEKKSIIESRQKAKEQARLDAEKRGEYEQASNILREQLEESKKLLAEYAPLAESVKELTGYKEKWESYTEKRRSDLLEQLPESKRESLKTLPIESLEEIVSLVTETAPGTMAHKGLRTKPSMGDVDDLSKLTSAQRVELKRTNPEKFAELTNKFFK